MVVQFHAIRAYLSPTNFNPIINIFCNLASYMFFVQFFLCQTIFLDKRDTNILHEPWYLDRQMSCYGGSTNIIACSYLVCGCCLISNYLKWVRKYTKNDETRSCFTCINVVQMLPVEALYKNLCEHWTLSKYQATSIFKQVF